MKSKKVVPPVKLAFSPYPQYEALSGTMDALTKAMNDTHACMEACRGKRFKTASKHWYGLRLQLDIAGLTSKRLKVVDGKLKKG